MARFPVLLVLPRCWQIMENARFSPRIGDSDRMTATLFTPWFQTGVHGDASLSVNFDHAVLP
jgi:hypothetical protein